MNETRGGPVGISVRTGTRQTALLEPQTAATRAWHVEDRLRWLVFHLFVEAREARPLPAEDWNDQSTANGLVADFARRWSLDEAESWRMHYQIVGHFVDPQMCAVVAFNGPSLLFEWSAGLRFNSVVRYAPL